MRILSLSHTFPLPADSGSSLRIWNVARRLAERHDLRLLSSGRPGRELSATEIPAWLESLPPADFPPADLPLADLSRRARRQLTALFRGIPASVQAHRSAALAQRVSELVRAGWPEVAIAEEGSAAIELELLPPSIPRVLVKHSVHAREVEERARRTPWPRRPRLLLEQSITRRYERRGIRQASAVVTVCEEDRRELVERYGAWDAVVAPNAVVVPNGCAEPGPPWKDPDRPRVGVLADFRWQPNRWELSWFLDRVRPRLIRSVPSLEIQIIGHPPDPPWPGPEMPDVQWLGRVDDVFAALRACRVLALPVRYGSGIRNRLLDGLALGMPIVTTPLGMRGCELEAGVDLEVAATAEAFAERLGALLTDPATRRLRSRAALRAAGELTWKRGLQRLEAHLERMVAER
ncbi:MAG: glycosyltransferase [Acidobacteriota bacterium]